VKCAGLIDTAEIAMAGQSAGGASTVTAMLASPVTAPTTARRDRS
jgi:carboxylesterase type B